MFANTICRPGLTGRISKWIRTAGLVLAAVFAVSLAASSQARAAECMELEDCLSAANWQKAIGDDYNNKAAWFRATSKQNFINAYEWNQKATFAFYAGDATAATWYKAIADDYSRKSVADAKAAENYANQAVFYAAAADNNFRRYLFMENAPDGGDGITTASLKDIGVKSLAKAKAICKGGWTGVACQIVLSKAGEEAGKRVLRYFWKMVNGTKCLRQQTRYNVNPSTGYVEKVYHVCVKSE